jgi:CBS domain-containing protein
VNLVLMLIGLGALAVLDGGLPQAFAAQIALTNGLVAALNLLPGLPLDGGSIVRAGVWAVTGRPRTGTIVTAWIGRGLAVAAAWWSITVLLRGGSVLTPVWGLFIAYWLWSSAGAALAGERVRAAVPGLTARGLARAAVPVLADEPVATVIARMQAAGARAAVVTDPSGRPTGVVSQAAVEAAPEERRPWLAAGTLARRIEPSLVLDADLTGEALMARLLDAPASEYLVQDADGRLVGVLAFADVEAALGRR